MVHRLTFEENMLRTACMAARGLSLPVWPQLYVDFLRISSPKSIRSLSIEQLHRGLKQLVYEGYLEDLGVLDFMNGIHAYWPTQIGFDQFDFWESGNRMWIIRFPLQFSGGPSGQSGHYTHR